MTEAERLASRLGQWKHTDAVQAATLLRSQAAEIESLKAECIVQSNEASKAQAENRFAHMNGYEGGKQEARDAAHAETESLKADAMRMDWLEREAVITYGYDRTVKVAFPLNELGRTVVTLRHTVDEAIKGATK